MSGELRIGGYPKKHLGSWALTDFHGTIISSDGQQIGCSKIRPGAPGHWIDSERCSYQFIVGGTPYSCRGYGEGIAVSCRRMKTKPRGLRGARRRKGRR